MTTKKTKKRVNKKQWDTTLDCEVEVLRMGHFPTSLIVKLPDGREIETDNDVLTSRYQDRKMTSNA
jgi:hypothetical protein